MKRGTMSITKFTKLKLRLQLPAYAAVGILEALWHLTAKEAPAGNIGKLSDEDIALFLEWSHAPETLITALIDCRWIDRHPTHRLVIHDWFEHAEDAIHMSLARRKQLFADGRIPNLHRLSQKVRAAVEEDLKRQHESYLRAHSDKVCAHSDGVSAQKTHESAQDDVVCALPKPSHSLSQAIAKPSQAKPYNSSESVSTHMRTLEEWFQIFYKDYPRKVKPRDAEKAFRSAIKRGATPDQIIAGLAKYTRHVAGKDPQYISHPATWLNGDGWLSEYTEPVDSDHLTQDQVWKAAGVKPRKLTPEEHALIDAQFAERIPE